MMPIILMKTFILSLDIFLKINNLFEGKTIDKKNTI